MSAEYNRFHTNAEFVAQSCSIHGRRFWTEDTGCRECARIMCDEEEPEQHNGAGCYDNDSDFS